MEKFNPDEVLEKLTLEFIGKSSILGIGSMFFSKSRQKVFKKFYKSMRTADDKVDDIKENNNGEVPIYLRSAIKRKLRTWIKSVKNNSPTNDDQRELIGLLGKMDIPFWPWEKLVEAMIYDLSHNGFKTFPIFLAYTEGAAVSPGAIFMHLCGARESDHGYKRPAFDIMKNARPLARFSYLVHIIRDFQEDHNDGLNYFSDDLLCKHGLNISFLRIMASEGVVNDSFRELIMDYYQQAEIYRNSSRQMLNRVGSEMHPRYLLSLEVLFDLYLQIFERISNSGCNFTTAEMNPTSEEIKSRIVKVVSSFNK